MMTKRPRGVGHAVLRSAVLAVAVGLGLSACSAAGNADSDSDRARELADQLDENLAAAGLPTLDTETAVTLYGTDGGVSCENAGELQQDLALSQFGNNALHLRRVVLDPSLLDYDLAVLQTYCPDDVDAFQDAVEDLDTEETIP